MPNETMDTKAEIELIQRYCEANGIPLRPGQPLSVALLRAARGWEAKKRAEG